MNPIGTRAFTISFESASVQPSLHHQPSKKLASNPFTIYDLTNRSTKRLASSSQLMNLVNLTDAAWTTGYSAAQPLEASTFPLASKPPILHPPTPTTHHRIAQLPTDLPRRRPRKFPATAMPPKRSTASDPNAFPQAHEQTNEKRTRHRAPTPFPARKNTNRSNVTTRSQKKKESKTLARKTEPRSGTETDGDHTHELVDTSVAEPLPDGWDNMVEYLLT